VAALAWPADMAHRAAASSVARTLRATGMFVCMESPCVNVIVSANMIMITQQ
jgi:hypothetical protein